MRPLNPALSRLLANSTGLWRNRIAWSYRKPVLLFTPERSGYVPLFGMFTEPRCPLLTSATGYASSYIYNSTPLGTMFNQMMHISAGLKKGILDTGGSTTLSRRHTVATQLKLIVLQDIFHPTMIRPPLHIAIELMNARFGTHGALPNEPGAYNPMQETAVASNFWSGKHFSADYPIGLAGEKTFDVMHGLFMTYNPMGIKYYRSLQNGVYGSIDAFERQSGPNLKAQFNPATLEIRLWNCLCIRAEKARQFRTNVLLARELFKFDQSDFRLFTLPISSRDKEQPEGPTIEKVRNIILKGNELEIPVEERDDLLAWMTDLPSSDLRQVVKAAAKLAATPSERQRMLLVA